MKNCFRKSEEDSPGRIKFSHQRRSADVFELLSKHFASLDCTRNNTRKRSNVKKQRPSSVVWNQPSSKNYRRRSVASYELRKEQKLIFGGKIQKANRRPTFKTRSLPNNLDYKVSEEDSEMISVPHNHHLNSQYRGPECWTTANSLERIRKRQSSGSSDGTSQLHGRSKSLTRAEPDGLPWTGPTAFYIDKNGRARQLGGSPAIPSQWMSSEDEGHDYQDNDAINHSIKNGHKLDKEIITSPVHSTVSSLRRKSPTPSKVDEAMTKKLIQAMKELKDIAEVARVIDKVDDEEWLMVFIGELGHMLRDLVKFGEWEENPIKKSTLLDVLLDLIRFLKERSGYKEHSRYSIALREGLHPDVIEENPHKYDTIKRLKKLSEQRKEREKEMEKWQRQLINLAGTLEKCLNVLEEKKAKSSTSQKLKRTEAPITSDYSSGETASLSPSSRRSKQMTSGSDTSFGSPTKGSNLWVRSPTPISTASRAKDDSWIKSPSSSTSSMSSKNKSRLWPAYNIEFSLPTVQLNVPGSTAPRNVESSPEASVIDSFISQTSHDHPIVKKIINGQQKSPVQSYLSRRTKDDRAEASVMDKIKSFESHRPRSHSDGSQLSRFKRPKSTPPYATTNISHDQSPAECSIDLTPAAKVVSEFVYHVPHSHNSNQVTRTLPTLYRSKSVEPQTKHRSRFNTSIKPKETDTQQSESPVRDMSHSKQNSTSSPSKQHVLDKLGDFMHPSDSEDELPLHSSSLMNQSESPIAPKSRNTEHNSSHGRFPGEESNKVKEDSNRKYKSSTDLGPSKSVRPKEASALPQPSPTPRANKRSIESHRKESRTITVTTRTTNTQCDLTPSQSNNEKNALDQMKQLKRRIDILQGGLKDARSENVEKERKISVLQARLDRTKKNVVYGETEKGALEEEIDRMKKESREGRRELREEITILQTRVEESERKLKRERMRSEKAESDVERLRDELRKSRRELLKMKEERDLMEKQIQKLNSELMQERGNSRSMQEENNKLEEQLSSANHDIATLKQNLEELERKKKDNTRGDEVTSNQDLLKAKSAIDELEDQNSRLSSENKRLLNALLCEQTMASEAAACFLEQVKYLDSELNLARECSELQAKEYQKEIGRLLAEKRKTENQSAEDQHLLNQEIDKVRDMLDAEVKKSKNLQEENERLQEQLAHNLSTITECVGEENIVPYYETAVLESSSSTNHTYFAGKPETTDQAVQFDDTSYTKMRAHDFYSLEAQRNAKKLTERGRQLQDDLNKKKTDLRERRKSRR